MKRNLFGWLLTFCLILLFLPNLAFSTPGNRSIEPKDSATLPEKALPALVFGQKYDQFSLVAFNRDGSLAVAIEGTDLVYWDTSSGRQLNRHHSSIKKHLSNGLSFVKKDRWLFEAGDGVVIIRDSNTAKILQSIKLPVKPEHVAISADGTRLAIHHKKDIIIYETAKNSVLTKIDDTWNEDTKDLNFCANNMLAVHRAKRQKNNLYSRISIYDANGTIYAGWDTFNTIFSMTSDLDGQRLGFVTLYTRDNPGQAWVWSPDQSKRPTLVFSYEKNDVEEVQAVAFVGDPKTIAVFNGKALELINLASGHSMASLPLYKDPNRSWAYARWMDQLQVRWNAEHHRLFYHGQNRSLLSTYPEYSLGKDLQSQFHTWKGVRLTVNQGPFRTLYAPGQITDLMWQGSKLLAIYEFYRRVNDDAKPYRGCMLWQDGRPEVTYSQKRYGVGYYAAYDDASGRLASAEYNSFRPFIEISGVDPYAGQRIIQLHHFIDYFRWVPGTKKYFKKVDKKIKKNDSTDFLAWIPGGSKLISANDNGFIWLWDIDIDTRENVMTGDLDQTIMPSIAPIQRMALSPKGKYLAVAGELGMTVLRLPQGKYLRRYWTESPVGRLSYIQWAKEEERLFIIEESGENQFLKTIAVDNNSGKDDTTSRIEPKLAWTYAVSLDGRYIAGQKDIKSAWVSIIDRHTNKLASIETGADNYRNLSFDPQTTTLLISTHNKITFWALEDLMQIKGKDLEKQASTD